MALFQHSPTGAMLAIWGVASCVSCAEYLQSCRVLLGLGDFSAVTFQEVFGKLDSAVGFKLSHSKTQKDRLRWAADALLLHWVFRSTHWMLTWHHVARISL